MGKGKVTKLRCVGMQYHVSRKVRDQLKFMIPFPVYLQREPENEVDYDAIKVISRTGGFQVGYVPAAIAAVYSPKIDEGKIALVNARMISLNVDDAEGIVEVQIRKAES